MNRGSTGGIRDVQDFGRASMRPRFMNRGSEVAVLQARHGGELQ